MIYGYARVSTKTQDLQLQIEQLKQAGAEVIYSEKQSGAKTDREELTTLLEVLQDGDKLIVTKADRISRSITQLRNTVEELTAKGITIHILNMGEFNASNLNDPMTKLLFNILGSFAEFERDMIISRTTEGRERAKELGVQMGMPKRHKLKGAILDCIEKVERGEMTHKQASEYCKCGVATFRRRLKEYRDNKGE